MSKWFNSLDDHTEKTVKGVEDIVNKWIEQHYFADQDEEDKDEDVKFDWPVRPPSKFDLMLRRPQGCAIEESPDQRCVFSDECKGVRYCDVSGLCKGKSGCAGDEPPVDEHVRFKDMLDTPGQYDWTLPMGSKIREALNKRCTHHNEC